MTRLGVVGNVSGTLYCPEKSRDQSAWSKSQCSIKGSAPAHDYSFGPTMTCGGTSGNFIIDKYFILVVSVVVVVIRFPIASS